MSRRRAPRRPAAVAAATVVLLLLLAACGGGGGSEQSANGGSTGGPKRPKTTARLAVLSPTAGEVTGPDVDVHLRLDGGTILPPTTTSLVANGGHIHAYLDDKLISMAYALDQHLSGLAPGPHSLRAEFVAADHQPFANRVVAAVLFQVQT